MWNWNGLRCAATLSWQFQIPETAFHAEYAKKRREGHEPVGESFFQFFNPRKNNFPTFVLLRVLWVSSAFEIILRSLP